jgi:predicted nuclease with TOPRIM domain
LRSEDETIDEIMNDGTKRRVWLIVQSHEQLKGELAALKVDYVKLVEANRALTKGYASHKHRVDQLIMEHDSLKKGYERLNLEYETLKQGHYDTAQEYGMLKDDYSILKREYSRLMSDTRKLRLEDTKRDESD